MTLLIIPTILHIFIITNNTHPRIFWVRGSFRAYAGATVYLHRDLNILFTVYFNALFKITTDSNQIASYYTVEDLSHDSKGYSRLSHVRSQFGGMKNEDVVLAMDY